ncbi:MAG: DUF2383 domain-containing protein [Pseudomonadota bacterium]
MLTGDITMNFFRTDGQAALNTLLVTTRETLDHYRDAMELVDTKLAELFRDICGQRRSFVHRLETAVRASGTLPAVPDPDKEAAEMLLHHVAALIKSHYARDLLEQRIEGEKKLAALVIEAQTAELDSPPTTLLNDFAQHISDTDAKLQSLQTQVSAQEE